MSRTDTSFGRQKVNEIIERQSGLCAGVGCFAKMEIEKGSIQYILPKSVGGTSAASNLEFLCTECAGMTSRTLRLPVHLLEQSRRWLDGQEEVRSFTHLVRIAVVDYITEEGGHVEQRMHEKAIRELEEAELENSRLKSYLFNAQSYLTQKADEEEQHLLNLRRG